MCDQRDRILDYLYDEGTPNERRETERHLESCDPCRMEVRSLRRVREDLLAWDVPEQSSVWTPFAPVPVVPWYRQVPSWAMAAAASVMFLIGVAGGGVGAQLLGTGPASPVVPVVTTAAAPAVAAPQAPTVDAEMLGQAVRSELAKSGYDPMRGATPVSLSKSPARRDPALEQRWREFAHELVGASEVRQLETIQAYLQRVANEYEWQRRDDAAQLTKLQGDVQFLTDQLRAIMASQQMKVQ